LEKKTKKPSQRREIRSQTPFGLRRLGAPPSDPCIVSLLSSAAVAFVESVSSVERTLLLRKITEITYSKCAGDLVYFFHALVPAFRFKPCNFCWWWRKNIFVLGAWYPSYDDIIIQGRLIALSIA